MAFRIKHPKSLPMLILYGFGVVSLPLIAALVYGAVHMGRLAEQSQDAVHQAAQAIEHANQITAQITRMERTGRQYLVLQDEGVLAAYRQTHNRFQETLSDLQGMPLDKAQTDLVQELLVAERTLFEHIQAVEPTPTNKQEVASTFLGLNAKAKQLIQRSNALINREVDTLRQDAAYDQKVLFWLAASLIPLSLASAGAFIVLIARPIRQVDHSIRQLGQNDFRNPVRVSGPQDLEYVGERLDWLRQRLGELEQEKARFLRHVSHELKTPLTAIREGAELMDEGSVGRISEEQSEIVRIIRSSAGQLQRLIENLLSFSTVQVGGTDLNLTQVDLRTLIREVVESHKPALLTKEITLETDLEGLLITADEAKLKTVIDNLVSNGIKFSPAGGHLHLSAKRHEDEAVIDVIDSGPGISEEEAEQIFEAFYQGPGQSDNSIRGSGLGLSITREYIAAHEGSIRVVNSGRGEGGHIAITLPLGEGREAA